MNGMVSQYLKSTPFQSKEIIRNLTLNILDIIEIIKSEKTNFILTNLHSNIAAQFKHFDEANKYGSN